MIKEKNNETNKILRMLLYFAISAGLWANFKQLWLQSNGFNVGGISRLSSVATFAAAIIVFLVITNIKMEHIRNLVKISLIFKIVSMIMLVVLNKTEYNNLIKLFFIIDLVTEKIYITSIYPLITLYKKDNNFFSKRKLTEYIGRDLGVLVGAIFIGKTLFKLNINYNICLLVSILILIIALVEISFIKINDKVEYKKPKIIKALKDKVTLTYFSYGLIGNIAYSTALGLKMLMLTNKLSFDVSGASWYFLIVGILADIIGIIALRYLNFKNKYLVMFIKFGIRMIMYFGSFISNNPMVFIIAITWSLLISTAYENVTEAPYINRIKTDYQLMFNNLRYFLWIIGEAIGLFVAGILYKYGIRYMLGFSSALILIQIIIQIILVGMLKKENKE